MNEVINYFVLDGKETGLLLLSIQIYCEQIVLVDGPQTQKLNNFFLLTTSTYMYQYCTVQ